MYSASKPPRAVVLAAPLGYAVPQAAGDLVHLGQIGQRRGAVASWYSATAWSAW